jgi:hypothetical protein
VLLCYARTDGPLATLNGGLCARACACVCVRSQPFVEQHAADKLRYQNKLQVANDLAMLKANHPFLKVIGKNHLLAGSCWFCIGDAEVEALAEALEGNTVCWDVRLCGSMTDASMGRLRRALELSGVVRVRLGETGVSEAEQAEVLSVCARNVVGRLKSNDVELKELDWAYMGTGDTEVEALAEGLEGNTVCQKLDLSGNSMVTDTSMGRLRRALELSGVVRVDLSGTGVSEAEQAAVHSICTKNAMLQEVHCILDGGVDVNATDVQGWSALAKASRLGLYATPRHAFHP